jgi:hypothetical protein
MALSSGFEPQAGHACIPNRCRAKRPPWRRDLVAVEFVLGYRF